MGLFCRFEMHRWAKRPATLNPARIVRRCKTCGQVSVIKIKPVRASGRPAPQPVVDAKFVPRHAR